MNKMVSGFYINIGFAGHRNVSADALPTIEQTLSDLFRVFNESATNISSRLSESDGGFLESIAGGAAQYRLLTGYAKGADKSAINAWNSVSLGEVHAVFPYVHTDKKAFAWSNDPTLNENGTEFTSIPKDVTRATALDGTAAQAEIPRRSGHLEQARWIVQQSDILVVVWDGDVASGAGGTAESVELAMGRGLPIFWINPHSPTDVLFIDPEMTWKDTSVFELRDIVAGGTDQTSVFRIQESTVIQDKLIRHLLPDWISEKTREIHRDSEKQSHKLARWIGALPPKLDAHYGNNQESELLSARKFFTALDKAETYAQTPRSSPYQSFSHRLSRPFQLLGWFWIPRVKAIAGKAKHEKASIHLSEDDTLLKLFQRVNQFSMAVSDRHRSQQIVILRLAALAVFLGLLPAGIYFFDEKPSYLFQLQFKWICVALELAVISTMLIIWWRARSQESHLLWSDARRLTERLRSVRATTPLGFDVSDRFARPPHTWSEWLIKLKIREVGPPTGKLTKQMIAERAETARVLIVESQELYHSKNAAKTHAIHERIEQSENLLFVLLFLCLVVFVTVVPIYFLTVADDFKLDNRIKNGILILSALVPALGASCMALSAQLELASSSRYSAKITPQFERINIALKRQLRESKSASITQITHLVRSAAQLSLSDIEFWRNNLERRRIVRGP